MADLVVLAFDSKQKAEEVWNLRKALQEERLVDLEDAAMVWRDADGEVHIEQALPLTAAGASGGAATGALWGTLIGLLFLNPLAGLGIGALTGAAAGAVSGALADIGIDDGFIKRLGETLQPGTAALFVLVRRATTDRVVEELRPYGPTVLHTNLTKDREDELVQALQGSS